MFLMSLIMLLAEKEMSIQMIRMGHPESTLNDFTQLLLALHKML